MKKSIFILFLALLLSLAALSASAAPCIGDTDGDGAFSLKDVLAVLRTVIDPPAEDTQGQTMDIDGDGIVSLRDAMQLLLYSLDGEKPSYCAVHDLYHEGCVWNYATVGDYDAIVFSSASFPDFKIRYKIYVPDDYSPHRSYALAVHFHGLGGENKDTMQLSGSTWFKNILSSEHGDETILLLPQCPVGMDWPHDRDTIEAVWQLIDYLTKHMHIDKSRMYLSGHSYGSMAVSYMIESHPNTFAAAVMGSGAGALSSYTSLESLATTPIRMFCGDADGYNFHIRFRALYAALLELGADVEYTEFPGLTHNIFGTVGNQPGLVDWAFSHTLGEK